MTQYQCEVTPIIDVPPSSFQPAPKVQSSVVKLIPRLYPLGRAEDIGTLNHVVSTAFQQRRKTLQNALKSLISSEQLKSLDIDPAQRPDGIDIASYIRIANCLTN